MACNRITAGDHARVRRRAADQGACSTPTTRPARRRTSASTRRKTDRWETDAAPLPRQLGHARQRLGGRVLPRRRVASAGARLREEPQPRPRGAVPLRLRDAQVPARLHRPGGRRPRRRRPAAPRRRDQGLPRARTRRRRRRRWTPTGCPASTTSARYGRWAFAEFTEVYQIEADFEAKVESAVQRDDRRQSRLSRRAEDA